MELKWKCGIQANQQGQATTEYILLLAFVVIGYMMFAKALDDIGAGQLLMRPITGPFAAAYQYGNPKAKGFDNGGPEGHPRVTEGKDNFRLFLNPDIR